MSQILAFFGPIVADHTYLAFFVFLLVFGFTLPISEEIALALVGVAARSQDLILPECLVPALPALLLADLLYYTIARLIGPRLLRMKLFIRFMKPERVCEGERYFQRRGQRIVFFCRFVIGLRAPAILSAGFLRMPLKRFIAFDGLALLIATPIWLAFGYALGAQLDSQVGTLGKIIAFVGPLAIVAGTVLVYRSVKADRARAEAEGFETLDQAAEAESGCEKRVGP
ncbi:MAG TPA: DedA family protein [Rectinemataceae bacterium]|nr:DedA family protein [Rectinemataceae bacterium]